MLNFDEHGIEIKRNYISGSVLEGIKNEISASVKKYPRHGIRGAEKKFSTIKKLTESTKLVDLGISLLGSKPQVVRAIYFDKTQDNNWLVSWHQDKTIAVNKKIDVPGWGPWSIKDEQHHVQPSLEVLNNMVTFRLHLDAADESNGCLKVIPKSHELGILSQQELTMIASELEPCLCEVAEGDLLIMKPHILHASGKSQNPGHRRVVHIEYSNYLLPLNLSWV